MENNNIIAIIEERRRQEKAHKATKAELERKEQEEKDRLNSDKVPALADELLSELAKLYDELSEEAGPEFKAFYRNPEVINVLVETASLKGALWKRLASWFASYRPRCHKKTAVWWGIAMARSNGNLLNLHLGIEDGTVYAQPLPQTPRVFDTAYALTLSYTTLDKLRSDIVRNRKSVAFNREHKG